MTVSPNCHPVLRRTAGWAAKAGMVIGGRLCILAIACALLQLPVTYILPALLHATIYPIWKLWGVHILPGPHGIFSLAANLAWTWAIAALLLALAEWRLPTPEAQKERWFALDILLGFLGVAAYTIYRLAA